ncbi:MAG: 3-methyl-2-oxobutanoate hydroxymethyltransferase, partial [Lentisphaeria bacterium]|nr:3-methyl-2-oxobutanoate hydroxymethyltransferase [Lentisphaeria bacterium]
MAKLTVAEFLACKGQRQLTQSFTMDVNVAKAYNDAGLDVLVTTGDLVEEFSAVTGNTMLIGAADFTEVAASDEAAIRIGFKLLDAGADGIYVGAHNIDRIKAMADAAIPVIGHVGLVPYRNTWFGGMRAVGKKADEALGIYER